LHHQLNWYDSNWTYRREISIDPSKIDDILTNFPMAVMFSSSTVDFTHFKDLGEDIRFTQSDGETLIDFEQERFASTTDGAVYWVKIPSVSSSATTTFYMYYGNAAASDGQNATGTWDSNFKGVYHLPDINDSTGDYTLTNHNSVAFNNGKIGKAADFGTGNTNKVLSIASTLGISTGSSTITWWYKTPATLANMEGIVHIMKNGGFSFGAWYGDWATTLYGMGSAADPNGVTVLDGSYTPDTNTWYYWVITSNGTTATLYVDNVEIGSWTHSTTEFLMFFVLPLG